MVTIQSSRRMKPVPIHLGYITVVWYSVRESNPSFRLERAASSTDRRTKYKKFGGDAGIRTADKNFYRVRALVFAELILVRIIFLLCYATITSHLQILVDRKRIELLPKPCKGLVLPLSLTAHKFWYFVGVTIPSYRRERPVS